MFVYDASHPNDIEKEKAIKIYNSYNLDEGIQFTFRKVISDLNFKVPFENLDADINAIVNHFQEYELIKNELGNYRLEILEPIFYRNKAAYIIGRINRLNASDSDGSKYTPLILPLHNEQKGLYIDTVIHLTSDVSIIFSFTRSYFMVDILYPSPFIKFIKTLIPLKQIAEIYNSIGYNKHGKTEMYRSFAAYIDDHDEQLIIAPGIKGMVMCVFTLPSYPLVFKLIKDKFDPPKKMTRRQVKSKYKLVSQHDRVGRMADTHEFDNLTINRSKFSKELLEELQMVAPSLVHINGNQVTIKHLYIERKMIPLNIYLNNANEDEAREAVSEYGNAIKQLASANIFPGDMLLKNFGVTRHRRVVFYDYDEINFLTECNFRKIPAARNDYEEFSSEAWYSVGPNDIFPEEFRKFLIGRTEIRQMFYEMHNDIFDVQIWKDMQNKLNKGEVVTVFPYRRAKRFKNRE
ncbi:UNVERIFIED_CONTAM: hypothetical protein GTU68_007992 [Idotea baltica]|nr:hypothetical protein [Idotea baltica]